MQRQSDWKQGQTRYGSTSPGKSEGWEAMYEREQSDRLSSDLANRTSVAEVMLRLVLALFGLSMTAGFIVFVVWVALAILGVS